MSKPRVAPGPDILDLDTDWMAGAACAQESDLPWLDGPTKRREAAAMRAVCASCQVRAACEDFAVTTHACAGWWAGRSFYPGSQRRAQEATNAQGGDAA